MTLPGVTMLQRSNHAITSLRMMRSSGLPPEGRQQLVHERAVGATLDGRLEAGDAGSPDVLDKVAEARRRSRLPVDRRVHGAGLDGEAPGPCFGDGHACHGTEGPAFRGTVPVVQDNERPVAGRPHPDAAFRKSILLK